MSLEQPKYCGNCGKKYLENATFCAYCGTPIPVIETNNSSKSHFRPPLSETPLNYQRGISSYQSPLIYRSKEKESPSPFIQHFKGVLVTPQTEMSQIVNKPNIIQPFFIVLVCGIVAAVSSFILLSKTNILLTESYSDPLLSAGMAEIEYIQLLKNYLIPFSTLISFFLLFFVSAFALWVVQSMISTRVPASERSFKIELTIAGWSFLPLIFYYLFEIVVIAVLVEPQTIEVNEMFDIILIGLQMDTLGIVITFTGLIFLIWRIIIVYFGIKSIDPEGFHATIISVVFAIVSFFFN